MNYILEGHSPVKESDIMKWAMWFEISNRIVKQEHIGDIKISTVFLGMDHSFGSGPPLLFETMVFGGELDEEQERCSTWKQAEAMHESMVKRVKEC